MNPLSDEDLDDLLMMVDRMGQFIEVGERDFLFEAPYEEVKALYEELPVPMKLAAWKRRNDRENPDAAT